MAMNTTPKSILKKPTYPATSSSTSRAERDQELALYHARILQSRKDVELEILLSMETLIDYPLATSPYDASNPSPEDAKFLKDMLRPFQPNDYDELILERNIAKHCGYALCPNPNRQETGGGIFRLVGTRGKAKDFRVVEKGELEKWCSEACAKRALYIRVQLSECPAWERTAVEYAAKIDLRDEPMPAEDTVMEGMSQLSIADSQPNNNLRGNSDLALERGEQGFAARDRLVEVKILEKEVKRKAKAPSLSETDLSGKLNNMHLTLEGHTPSFNSRKQVDASEDDNNDDWML